MSYVVRVVEDDQLAADWVVLGRAGAFYLFVRRAFDTPETHARARKVMLTAAAA